MTISFSLDDLKQSIPGIAGLADVADDALPDALRILLGKAAEGATIRVNGKIISLD